MDPKAGTVASSASRDDHVLEARHRAEAIAKMEPAAAVASCRHFLDDHLLTVKAIHVNTSVPHVGDPARAAGREAAAADPSKVRRHFTSSTSSTSSTSTSQTGAQTPTVEAETVAVQAPPIAPTSSTVVPVPEAALLRIDGGAPSAEDGVCLDGSISTPVVAADDTPSPAPPPPGIEPGTPTTAKGYRGFPARRRHNDLRLAAAMAATSAALSLVDLATRVWPARAVAARGIIVARDRTARFVRRVTRRRGRGAEDVDAAAAAAGGCQFETRGASDRRDAGAAVDVALNDEVDDADEFGWLVPSAASPALAPASPPQGIQPRKEAMRVEAGLGAEDDVVVSEASRVGRDVIRGLIPTPIKPATAKGAAEGERIEMTDAEESEDLEEYVRAGADAIAAIFSPERFNGKKPLGNVHVGDGGNADAQGDAAEGPGTPELGASPAERAGDEAGSEAESGEVSGEEDADEVSESESESEEDGFDSPEATASGAAHWPGNVSSGPYAYLQPFAAVPPPSFMPQPQPMQAVQAPQPYPGAMQPGASTGNSPQFFTGVASFPGGGGAAVYGSGSAQGSPTEATGMSVGAPTSPFALQQQFQQYLQYQQFQQYQQFVQQQQAMLAMQQMSVQSPPMQPPTRLSSQAEAAATATTKQARKGRKGRKTSRESPAA